MGSRWRPVALIVEADEELRNIASTLLEETGLATFAVADLDEAEAFIESHPWTVEFLFLDAPGQRAEELIARVHQNSMHVYVAATNPTVARCPNVRRLGSNWAPLDLLIAAAVATERFQRMHPSTGSERPARLN